MMIRNFIPVSYMRGPILTCIMFVVIALFALPLSPALAAGSCYVGKDQSTGEPEFITREREEDCIDNDISSHWVVLILKDEAQWGWALFSTQAEVQDGARSRRPLHEPEGRTVTGPYPRGSLGLTASYDQDSYSADYNTFWPRVRSI